MFPLRAGREVGCRGDGEDWDVRESVGVFVDCQVLRVVVEELEVALRDGELVNLLEKAAQKHTHLLVLLAGVLHQIYHYLCVLL